MATKIAVANRFVQAKNDSYGNRRGPALALVYHMAEGNNVWRYLSTGNIARGVSVHFTVEADGEIVQMMGLNRISGSVNPDTIRVTNDAYYGAKHAKGVLGSWWKNPNNATLSVEIAGKAVNGPNAKQVASCVKLFEALRVLYPSIVPLGHRDFQSVKRCPGTTASMKSVFTKCGGHGLDYKKPTAPSNSGASNSTKDGGEMIVSTNGIKTTSDTVVTIKDKTKVYFAPDDKKEAFIASGTNKRELYGYGRFNDSDWMAVRFNTKQTFSDGVTRPVIGWVKGRLPVERRPVAPADPLQAQVADLTAKLEKARKALTDAGVAVDNASDIIQQAEAAVK